MTEPMYIRFGAPPASGRSWNDEDQREEAGVSVYRAEWQSTDRDVICVAIPSDTCIGTLNQCDERPVYIVTGRILAERGGDGELLMADVEVLDVVDPAEVVNYVVEEV